MGVESRESESGEQVWPYRQVGALGVGRAFALPFGLEGGAEPARVSSLALSRSPLAFAYIMSYIFLI